MVVKTIKSIILISLIKSKLTFTFSVLNFIQFLKIIIFSIIFVILTSEVIIIRISIYSKSQISLRPRNKRILILIRIPTTYIIIISMSPLRDYITMIFLIEVLSLSSRNRKIVMIIRIFLLTSLIS